MKRARFTEEQSISIPKRAGTGVRVADLRRRHGFFDATFYKWRSEVGGMNVSDVKRPKRFEGENARLKSWQASGPWIFSHSGTRSQKIFRSSGPALYRA
ncbi:transposase [uncultured Desulfovibrio sp.]|uniref:transposase n=1 Tax=uncultured Desulfovibrio sp. TaxID=167968 RepID=UPI00345C2548